MSCFPIHFQFDHQPVTAYVLVRPAGYDLNIRVQYQDERIRKILPAGSAVFSLVHGMQDLGDYNEKIEKLIEATTDAILHHYEFIAA